MVCKMFPYKNVHGDHVRPRWICRCAHPFVDRIRPLDMEMYPLAFKGSSTQPSASSGIGLKVPNGPFSRPTTPLGIGAANFTLC